MARTVRNKTASVDSAIQAEIDKLVTEIEKADKLDHTIESASEAIEALRWTTAERIRHIVQDGKVAATTLAEEIGKTPAFVRQAASVASLYGEDEYRIADFNYNSHLELAKLKPEDRDAVVKYASEYGCSVKVAREKVKAAAAKKVVKASDDDTETKSSSGKASSSTKSRPKLSGKGGIEQLNKELRSFVGEVSELSSLIATAIKQGARLTAKEAKELTAIAETLAEAAGASTAEAPATEVAAPKATAKAAPKKVTKRVVRKAA